MFLLQVMIEELPAASAATSTGGVRQALYATSETNAPSELKETSWAATVTSFAARLFGLAARHSAAADTADATVFELAAPVAQTPPVPTVPGSVASAMLQATGDDMKQAGQVESSEGLVTGTEALPGQTPMQVVPNEVATGAVAAADKSQAAHAARDSRESVLELPAQAAVVELPPAVSASQAAAEADLAAQAAKLSDTAAGAGVVVTPKQRVPPGLESELEAARITAEAAAEGIPALAEQPPPGNNAAADNVGLPEDATEVLGQLPLAE